MKYVINGECKNTYEVLTEVVEANDYDDTIKLYLNAHPTAICINVDVLTKGTAKDYGVSIDKPVLATQYYGV